MANATSSALRKPELTSLGTIHTPSRAYPKYLHKRGGQFYFRRKIPSDVAYAFTQARDQVWKALGTGLLEKARVLLAVEVTEFELKVAKLRKQNAHDKVCELGLFRPEGNGGNAIVVAANEQLFQSSPNDSEGGAHNQILQRIERELQMLRRLASASSSPEKPKKVATPAATVSKVKASKVDNKPTLLTLFEFWQVKQSRTRTIQAVKNTVLEFQEKNGSLPAESITREHARTYRDLLIEKHLSDGTIENRIGFLSTLFRFGQVEIIEHVLANPFERIPVNGGQSLRAEKDRRAYQVSELNTLFKSRLYTKGYRPRGQAVDAAYWAPLLGPFVGGRIEEIAQLRIQDIERINGVWCIRICNIDEDQNVKNPGSYRRVPLHQTLICCGFLLYAAEQQRSGHERLFPSLSNENANGVWSNALGKWFGRYLDSLGMTDPRLDYHSFRYTFRQQCSLSGIENEVRDALTGHWISNKDSGRTYMRAEERQYPFPKLVTAIGQLRYDELRIDHLFVAEPMKGVEEALLS